MARPIFLVVWLVCLALPLAGQAGRTHRVNEPFPLVAAEDVDEFAWSSDGAWLAYWVVEAAGTATLYCRASDAGAAALALHTRAVAEDGGVPRFLSGGEEILFDLLEDGRRRVLIVPRDGSSAAVEPLGLAVKSYVLTSDEARFVFVADPFTAERFVLMSQLRSGGAPLVLNGPLLAGGDVEEFTLTGDAARVVYWANETAGYGLHSAPVDAAGASTHLNSGVQPLYGFRLASGSERVVFRASAPAGTRVELYAVPADGSAPAAVISHDAGHADVRVESDFALTPDGVRAVFRSDRFVDGKLELFSVPVAGSVAPVQLSPAMPDTSDVADFLLSPDGASVAWRADGAVDERLDLHAAPSDGSATASVLAVPADEEDVDRVLLFDAEGARVAFLAGRTGQPTQKLLAVPVDASAAPLLIDDRLSDLALASPAELASDGERLLYRRFVGDGQELVLARLDGLTAPLRLASGDQLGRHALAPDGLRAAFVADLEADTVAALFTRVLDGSAPALRVSQDFVPLETYGKRVGSTPGGVFSSLTNAERIVYVADQDTSGRTGLYSAPLHAPGPRLLLSATSGGRADVVADGRIELAAGGARVLWRGWIAEREWLFSSRVERALDPIVLNVAPQPYATIAEYRVAPDGQTAVFLSDHEVDERFELYAGPLAVQGVPAKLSGTLTAGGDVLDTFRITSDGARVVYVADQDADETFELYSATGVGAAVELSGAVLSGRDVEPDFLLANDGTRAYFLGDLGVANQIELYSVPVDGSATRIKLNGALTAGSDVLSVDHEANEGVVLFHALLDGTVHLMGAERTTAGAPWSLSGSLASYQAGGVLLAPDGETVVFHAARGGSFHQAIFAVSAFGGTPVQLTHNAPGQGSVRDLPHFTGVPGFQLTPDGTRLLYAFTPSGGASVDLYVVPLDRSAAPVRLSAPGTGPGVFRPDPSSRWVFYGSSRFDRVRLDLSAPAQRVFSSEGGQPAFDVGFTPEGAAFVFRRAPLYEPRDLYVNHLAEGPVGARSATPTGVATRTP